MSNKESMGVIKPHKWGCKAETIGRMRPHQLGLVTWWDMATTIDLASGEKKQQQTELGHLATNS